MAQPPPVFTPQLRPKPAALSPVRSRALPLGPALAPGFPASARGGAQLRMANVQRANGIAGNRAAQRMVQSLQARAVDGAPQGPRATTGGTVIVLRDAAAANGQGDAVEGDAAASAARFSGDASARASELEGQGASTGAGLQAEAGRQGAALQGEAAARSGAIEQQSAAGGAMLQGQASAQGARVTAESATRGAALQQDASGASQRLEGAYGTLEASARATEAATQSALDGETAGLHEQSAATAAAVGSQWSAFEGQTTQRANGMTARTQALVDQKAALVREFEGPGAHDPERFQRRWSALQAQVAPLEQEQSELDRVQPAGDSLGDRAGTLWSAITGRGQALVGRIAGVAATAWNSVQGGWTSLQGAAASALAGLQARAAGAVDGLKSLAAGACATLQGVATQAWTGLQGAATGAWTGLQAAATAAWTTLQTQATAAWTALQGVAGSVVSSLANTASGLVDRIGGAVSRIVDAIKGALGSVLSRLRSATAGALDALRTRASAAWNSVKGLGARAWQGMKDLGERAWQGTKDLGSRAWSGLKSLGTRAWQGLKDLGARAWNGLKDLGQRAWNGLKSGWDWVKKKAQAAWGWLKGAWDTLKRKAGEAWDWLKRKAKEAAAWLKRKWAALKSWLAKAWAWLKAKWRWLKELVKITIRIPDQTLCKVHNFKPWKFVDIKGGRVPLLKTIVDPGIGPVELALFVQANAEATVAGSIGPCTLKNIAFTIQPLVSRYAGQADFHMAGSAVETLHLTGTIGGTANYGGLIGLVGGGLEGKGSATALANFEARPRFVYDSGKLSASMPVALEFCLLPAIDLGAFVTAKLIAGKPPAPATKPSPTPLLPGPMTGPQQAPAAGGCWTGHGPTQVPAIPGQGAGPGAKKPDEEILKEWIKRWHIRSWTKKECWRLGAKFELVAGGGALPGLDVKFDAAPISLADLIRDMFELPPDAGKGGPGGGTPPRPGGGDPDEPGIQKTVTASGRCKCVGDDNCGGGKIYEVCYTTQKDCKSTQKDLDNFCNNNSEMKAKCTRPKCYYRHSDPCCPDKCNPGDIRPKDVGPVGPQASCKPVTPSGSPTVNKPAGENSCTPDVPRPDWDVIEADAANWGVCVSALPLSGTINIRPWPSQPNAMVTPNTANAQDGGNIDNTAGSRNRWSFAIDDMADYDSARGGGAGAFWHATSASEAHEWAHWNQDFKADAVPSAAGGDWARTNTELNALREPKASRPTQGDARKALQPRVDARVATFRGGIVKRWNEILKTDLPGKGGRGYAAGMAVLNQYIAQVRNYKDRKGW